MTSTGRPRRMASPSSSWRPLALLAGGLLSALAPACVECTDQGCSAGLAWEGTRSDGSALEPGEYRIELQLESTRLEASCTIAETTNDTQCSEFSVLEGEQDWFVSVFAHAGESGGESAPTQINLRAEAFEGGDEVGNFADQIGPDSAQILIEREGAELFSVSYDSIEYERDETFWGDEACGACELEERRQDSW